MANICNTAIVVQDKSSFNKIVSYLNSDKFESLCEKNDLSTQMTGAEYDMLDYVIRVESKWGPEDIVFEKISKLVSEKVTVYSNTEGGEGFWTGITTFEDGKLLDAKVVPADIRDAEFRNLIRKAFKNATWYVEGENGTLILRPSTSGWGGDSWWVSVESYDDWSQDNPIVKKKDYGLANLTFDERPKRIISEFFEANNL